MARSRYKLHTWTIHNPYPYNRTSDDNAKRLWDYVGQYRVVRRNWHMKDGKRLFIHSVVVTDDRMVRVFDE